MHNDGSLREADGLEQLDDGQVGRGHSSIGPVHPVIVLLFLEISTSSTIKGYQFEPLAFVLQLERGLLHVGRCLAL